MDKDEKKQESQPIEEVNPEIKQEMPEAIAEETIPEEAPKDEILEAAPETTEAVAESPTEQIKAIALKHNPEADVSTPEALLSAIAPLVIGMDGLHTWLNESIEIEPAAADMFIDVKNGSSWAMAIAKNFDVEDLMQMEGAEEGKAERMKRYEEQKAMEAKWGENEILSANNFIAAADKAGLPEEQRENVAESFGKLLLDAADRNISVDNWMLVMNGLRHETVVAEKDKEKEAAFEDGKVAGRNEKIEKKRLNPEKSDGLARLTGTGAEDSATKEKMKKPLLPIRKEFKV